MKLKGFTLIELLVVIVIIGILATISVATFSGYFQKARDAERQTAVQNASTVLKTAYAVGTLSSFDTTGSEISASLASEGGYNMPAAVGGYAYAFIENGSDEFAFIVCGEETDDSYFVNGTATAVDAIATANGTTLWCDTSVPDITPVGYTLAGYTVTAAVDGSF